MFTWLSTAREETCRVCGGLAILLARTRRCSRCEAGAYGRKMDRYGWWGRAPMMRREQASAVTGQERPPAPAAGEWVVDTHDDRTGLVKAVVDGRLHLRTPSGGIEWQAMPAHVRPATASEALSARVAEANAGSSAGIWRLGPGW